MRHMKRATSNQIVRCEARLLLDSRQMGLVRCKRVMQRGVPPILVRRRKRPGNSESVVRSYQISVTVHSPLTLQRPSAPDDREAMFRYLNDLLDEVSIEVGAFARERLELARQAAAEVGYVLGIPSLAEPMGMAHGLTDVTDHIGQRWRGTSQDAEPDTASDPAGA